MDGNDKNHPFLLRQKRGDQMLIYEREFRLLGKSDSVQWVKAVNRGTSDNGLWELEVKIQGEKEHAILVTSHNKPRQFPNLNFLQAFIHDTCPSISSIEVRIRQT